jgi:hypothetical protein
VDTTTDAAPITASAAAGGGGVVNSVIVNNEENLQLQAIKVAQARLVAVQKGINTFFCLNMLNITIY